MGETKLDWTDIAIEGETQAAQGAYAAYRKLRQEAGKAQAEFERIMREDHAQDVCEGERLVFGYRFGKLSFAVAPEDGKPARKAAAPKRSLGDYLAARRANGLGT